MDAAATSDLSLLDLFLKSDIVVKGVMLTLVLASLASWAIAIDKWLLFGSLRSRGDAFEKKFWDGSSIEELARAPTEGAADALARVYQAGVREWRETRVGGGAVRDAQATLLRERCDRVMGAAIQRETARASKGLGQLATIASATPFIGLFGTVWGIMNAFTAIAGSQETSLAVVAPGIAEALFATALGLVAAIPATVFYNAFSADVDRLATQLDTFADEFVARLSRRLEEQLV